MPSWPDSMPAPLVQGYSEEYPNNVLRSEVDAGPAKTRRLTTANVGKIGFQLFLNDAQMTDFETFYFDTVKGGALIFDMPHPRRGTDGQFRFAAPPGVSVMAPNCNIVQVQLEVLP